jgi:hypothetical protein
MARSDSKTWILGSLLIAMGAGAALAYLHRRTGGHRAPRHVHAIDSDTLEGGDILLFRSGKKSLASSVIRHWTKSPYSHAGIFLGNGEVLEAIVPRIKINPLKIPRGGYVGVIRSQLGFGVERQRVLCEFADQLVNINRARYDLRGVLQFVGIRSEEYKRNIAAIRSRAANIRGDEKTRYFCSALVARIWCIVGIMDESAWPLMMDHLIAPGDIAGDVNFGWFLGYLISPGTIISDEDPLQRGTVWNDVLAA